MWPYGKALLLQYLHQIKRQTWKKTKSKTLFYYKLQRNIYKEVNTLNPLNPMEVHESMCRTSLVGLQSTFQREGEWDRVTLRLLELLTVTRELFK